MDLHQLKYFQTVARLEHVTRAAEELYIAQPSLSKAIARLEEELGVPLFDHHGRRIQLNQFGRAFLRRVERAFAELEEGQREVADMADTERGLVGLAALYTVGAHLLPELLSAFRARHPQISFRLFQNAAHSMLKQLDKGEIDLCISSPLSERPGVVWSPLMTEEILLAVPAGHHLAGRDSIRLSEVAQEPFISLKPGTGLRTLTDRFCQQAGFEPRSAFEVDELTVVSGLVGAGFGVAFLPALARTSAGGPARLHINEPRCQRTIGLAWIEGRYLSSAARLFRQFVIEYFAQLERHP
jgi:LysR family transcriptional activator of glutamate synthase operon